jgi:DnaA family protein
LQLADHAVFASFHAAGNETLLATLQRLAAGEGGEGCWLWGGVSTGKTHLLQAVCDSAGDQSIYVPLAILADAGPDILEGLARRLIVCIDDVDVVAGDADWELALFSLFNDLQDQGNQLVVSAAAAPRECGFRLAAALQLRAGHRGIDLPDETAVYLLRRVSRDMASLYAMLDRLDLEALRAKRRLTIPFVRDVLKSG